VSTSTTSCRLCERASVHADRPSGGQGCQPSTGLCDRVREHAQLDPAVTRPWRASTAGGHLSRSRRMLAKSSRCPSLAACASSPSDGGALAPPCARVETACRRCPPGDRVGVREEGPAAGGSESAISCRWAWNRASIFLTSSWWISDSSFILDAIPSPSPRAGLRRASGVVFRIQF